MDANFYYYYYLGEIPLDLQCEEEDYEWEGGTHKGRKKTMNGKEAPKTIDRSQHIKKRNLQLRKKLRTPLMERFN